MKKNQLFVYAIVFITFIVMISNTSCRKGEDDPLISLKSRNARLMQEWNLAYIEGTRISSYDTIRYEYDGNTFLRIRNDDTLTTINGNLIIEFKENGVSNVKETIINDGETHTNEGIGTWSWLDSDKDKNFLFIWNETFLDSYFLHDYTIKYYVSRLASKELVLKIFIQESWGGSVWIYDFTYTFTTN
jgi:hypothetical protein